MIKSPSVESLCDEKLIALWQDLESDLDWMSDGIAQDESERALYGDGPCGSMDRRHEYDRINRDLNEVAKEWYKRHPLPVQPQTPDDEIPF